MKDELLKFYKFHNQIESDEILKFIADSLHSISNSSSKLKIITLVSLIEILIIKKPDANRYHIEDSIKKQFVLKIGMLLIAEEGSRNIEEIRNQLRELYDQRSNIAHGNFKTFDQIASKKRNNRELIEEYTIELEDFSRKVLRTLLLTYLTDQDRIAFLKNN